jgi:hypothetical protein
MWKFIMLRPMPIEPVPHETARVARATLPTEKRDRRLADARQTLFTDAAFLTLFPTHGQPALPPGGWHSSRCCHAPNGSPSTCSTGFAWVHLGHVLTAVGLNVRRLGEWLQQTAPAKTRVTPFARLMTAPVAA